MTRALKDDDYRLAVRDTVPLVEAYRIEPTRDLKDAIARSLKPLVPYIERQARNHTRSQEDAEELAWGVLTELCRSCTEGTSFELDEVKIFGWLKLRIASRRADHWREEYKRPEQQGAYEFDDAVEKSRVALPPEGPDETFERGFSMRSRLELLLPLLRRLRCTPATEWMADVIVLRIVENQTHKRTIEIMNDDSAYGGRIFTGPDITDARKVGRRYLMSKMGRPSDRPKQNPAARPTELTGAGEKVEQEDGIEQEIRLNSAEQEDEDDQ